MIRLDLPGETANMFGNRERERPMRLLTSMPPGVRLDSWPSNAAPQPPKDSPEIANLREELRNSQPYLADQMDMLAKLRELRDLASRMTGPPPARLTTREE
jgi:hypothetical protein